MMDNLKIARALVHDDWDMIGLYDGYVGSGKSVKAQQDAYYLDPTFNLDRICFTAEEFTKAVNKAEKFQAVIYDEAYTGMSSKDSMKNVNKALEKRLTEIRQKNLFILIVMPTIFDLAKHIAIWRAKYLVHVYTVKNKRGFFQFYNKDKKKDLYVQGQKYYSYYSPNPNFRGRFTNHYTVSELRYRNKKDRSLNDALESDDTTKKVLSQAAIHKKVKEDYIARLMNMKDLSGLQKANILAVKIKTWESYVTKYNLKLNEARSEN